MKHLQQCCFCNRCKFCSKLPNLLHQDKQATAAAGKPVVAPLPGTINEIKVKVGDKVNAGDTVVILEAMKMQNNIEAETSGTITSINVNKGDAVMEGDTLGYNRLIS